MTVRKYHYDSPFFCDSELRVRREYPLCPPISLVGQIPNVLIVRPSLHVKNLKELVEYGKANPGKLNYGSGGVGSAAQLASELFRSFAMINVVHVPYKGSIQALTGMMSNEVDMIVMGIPPSLAHIQSGKVRALAVLSAERLPSLPDVPTAKEAGFDNYEVTTWYGILAPAVHRMISSPA